MYDEKHLYLGAWIWVDRDGAWSVSSTWGERLILSLPICGHTGWLWPVGLLGTLFSWWQWQSCENITSTAAIHQGKPKPAGGVLYRKALLLTWQKPQGQPHTNKDWSPIYHCPRPSVFLPFKCLLFDYFFIFFLSRKLWTNLQSSKKSKWPCGPVPIDFRLTRVGFMSLYY